MRAEDDVVRAVLGACAGDPSAIVAFDGDGTLWTGDVGEDLFFHVLRGVAVLEPAARAAGALARAYGVAEGATAKETLEAIWAAYEEGTFPEPEVCELVAWCLAGRARSGVEEVVRAVHGDGEMLRRLRPAMARVVRAVRDAGVESFVVSASPAIVVRPVAAALGWDAEHVVALETAWEGGVMRAEAVRPIPYDDGKVTCLRARAGSRRLAAAFGDSGFDVPLLAAASVGVAVHPKPALRARLPANAVVLAGA